MGLFINETLRDSNQFVEVDNRDMPSPEVLYSQIYGIPVNVTDEYRDQVREARDVYAGEYRIKRLIMNNEDLQDSYLPALRLRRTQESKKRMINETWFINIFAPQVEEMVGNIFQNEPVINIGPDRGDGKIPASTTPSSKMDYLALGEDYADLSLMLDSIGQDGQSLPTLMKDVLKDILVSGKAFLWVDREYDVIEDAYYPVVKVIKIDDVISYKVSRGKITGLWIKHEGCDYVFSSQRRYIDTARGAEIPDDYLKFCIYKFACSNPQRDGDKQTYNVSRYTPVYSLGDEDLADASEDDLADEVPVIPISPKGVSLDMDDRPYLSDVVAANKELYRSIGSLNHVVNRSANPMPFFRGDALNPDDIKKYANDSDTAIVIPDGEAKASFLELNGRSLEGIESTTKLKVEYMRPFRINFGRSRDNGEALETVRFRERKECSALRELNYGTVTAYTKLIKLLARLFGLDDIACEIILPNDYMNGSVGNDTLEILAGFLSTGIVTPSMFVDVLIRAGLASDQMLPEERVEFENLIAVNVARMGVIFNDIPIDKDQLLERLREQEPTPPVRDMTPEEVSEPRQEETPPEEDQTPQSNETSFEQTMANLQAMIQAPRQGSYSPVRG